MLSGAGGLISVLAISTFVGFKFRDVWANRRDLDRRLLYSWLCSLLLLAGLIFQLRDVFIAAGYRSGIPNLAWLLSYLFTAGAIYTFILTVFLIRNRTPPRWVHYNFVIIELLLVGVFFGSEIARSTPNLVRTTPRSTAELVFMNLGYGYCFSHSALIRQAALGLSRLQEGREVRLRMEMLVLAASASVLMALLKITASVAGFYALPLPLPVLFRMTDVLALVAVLSWPLVFVPPAVYRPVERGLHLIGNLERIFRLAYIYRRFRRACPRLTAIPPLPWRREIRDTDLCIHRLTVSILDGAASIAANPSDYPAAAAEMAAEVRAVANEPSFDRVVTGVVGVSKRMLRRRLAGYISTVFYPLVTAGFTLIFLALAAGCDIAGMLKWNGIIVGVSFVPVLAAIGWGVRRGAYGDYDVSTREHRHALYLLCILSLAALNLILHLAGAPHLLRDYVLAGTLGMAVGGMINRWGTKISGHTFVSAGSAAAVFTVNPGLGLGLVGVTLLVGWSRIELKRHTPRQVALGLVVGIGSVLPVFFIL